MEITCGLYVVPDILNLKKIVTSTISIVINPCDCGDVFNFELFKI